MQKVADYLRQRCSRLGYFFNYWIRNRISLNSIDHWLILEAIFVDILRRSCVFLLFKYILELFFKYILFDWCYLNCILEAFFIDVLGHFFFGTNLQRKWVSHYFRTKLIFYLTIGCRS